MSYIFDIMLFIILIVYMKYTSKIKQEYEIRILFWKELVEIWKTKYDETQRNKSA